VHTPCKFKIILTQKQSKYIFFIDRSIKKLIHANYVTIAMHIAYQQTKTCIPLVSLQSTNGTSIQ